MTSKSDVTNPSIFNNPLIESVKRSLSPEELAHYEKLGKALYADVEFETSKSISNIDPPMVEAIAYIESSLRSGMHPSYLDDNEKMILKNAYGDDWVTRYGYVSGDKDTIVTLMM
jgi:hypothetical protein